MHSHRQIQSRALAQTLTKRLVERVDDEIKPEIVKHAAVTVRAALVRFFLTRV